MGAQNVFMRICVWCMCGPGGTLDLKRGESVIRLVSQCQTKEMKQI